MHLRETSDIIVLRRPKVKRLRHPTTIPPPASDHPAPPHPETSQTKTKSAPEGALLFARDYSDAVRHHRTRPNT